MKPRGRISRLVGAALFLKRALVFVRGVRARPESFFGFLTWAPFCYVRAVFQVRCHSISVALHHDCSGVMSITATLGGLS